MISKRTEKQTLLGVMIIFRRISNTHNTQRTPNSNIRQRWQRYDFVLPLLPSSFFSDCLIDWRCANWRARLSFSYSERVIVVLFWWLSVYTYTCIWWHTVNTKTLVYNRTHNDRGICCSTFYVQNRAKERGEPDRHGRENGLYVCRVLLTDVGVMLLRL